MRWRVYTLDPGPSFCLLSAQQYEEVRGGKERTQDAQCMKEIAGKRWCSTCKLRPPVKKLPTTPPQLALVNTCATATVDYRQAYRQVCKLTDKHAPVIARHQTRRRRLAYDSCTTLGVEGIAHTCCTPQSRVSNCSRRLRVTGFPSARGLVSSTLWLTAKVAASTTPCVQEDSCKRFGPWSQLGMSLELNIKRFCHRQRMGT